MRNLKRVIFELANYLKKLPEDPDFSTIPTEFRDKLSEYLTTQKNHMHLP